MSDLKNNFNYLPCSDTLSPNENKYNAEFHDLAILEYVNSLTLKGEYLIVGEMISNISVFLGLFGLCEKLHCYEQGNTNLLQSNIQKNNLEKKCIIEKYTTRNPFIPKDGLINISLVMIENINSLVECVNELITILKLQKPILIINSNSEVDDNVKNKLSSIGYILSSRGASVDKLYEFISVKNEHKQFFDVGNYWESRYQKGGNSGAGSYNRLAKFKASFLNGFVKNKNISSVLELGCGDGAQLALLDYPSYIGVDISPTIINKCKTLYSGDSSKTFFSYDGGKLENVKINAELVISLDVIYHLSNDDIYNTYLDNLFLISRKYVVIYSNSTKYYSQGVNEQSEYVRFRDFLSDINERYNDWNLIEFVPNMFPFNVSLPTETSFADFYVFSKKSVAVAPKIDWQLSLQDKMMRQLVVGTEQVDITVKQNKSLIQLSNSLVKVINKEVVTNQTKSAKTLGEIDKKIIQSLAVTEELLATSQSVQLTLNNQLLESKTIKKELYEGINQSQALQLDLQKQLGNANNELHILHEKNSVLAKQFDASTLKMSEVEQKNKLHVTEQADLIKDKENEIVCLLDEIAMQAQKHNELVQDYDYLTIETKGKVDDLNESWEKIVQEKLAIIDEYTASVTKGKHDIGRLKYEFEKSDLAKCQTISEYTKRQEVAQEETITRDKEQLLLELEISKLRTINQSALTQTNNIKISFAYRLGRLIVDAFRKPSFKTITFPYTFCMLFTRAIYKKTFGKLKGGGGSQHKILLKPLNAEAETLPDGYVISLQNSCLFEFDICEGGQLSICADVFYSEKIKSQSREALIAIEYSKHKSDQALGNCDLPFSKNLNTFFQYLPNTQSTFKSLYKLNAPKNAAKVALNLLPFGKNALGLTVAKKIKFELNNTKLFLSKASPTATFRFATFDKCQIDINVNTNYQCENKALIKQAVVLIRYFSKLGEEIKPSIAGFSYSKKFDAQFKYLNDTEGEINNIAKLTPPLDVSYLTLELHEFGLQSADSINVNGIIVNIAPPETEEKFVAPSKQAAEISILGWPEYKETTKPTVIGIMDEFTTGCFESDLNLIQPRPDNWYALAEKYKPEIFFLESAWKGNYGSWQYRVANYANKPGQEVNDISLYAKKVGIPLVFWNKEDPVHHDKFMCSAKVADYIFTTDANMCESYKQKTGNNNVFALPFAAQPELHKPAPLSGRINKPCFAGSWYGNRHAERGESMNWLLSVANEYGLDIYDRNHGTGIFPFPEKFQKGIKGSLPYKALCNEYNRYRVFLNVNSVTDSPTMFSRRVFELMACGTPVISTYARGIDELFESGAVWLVNSPKEAKKAMQTLMEDDVEWRRRSLAGIREVFAKHTYAHRINEVFEKIGSSKITNIDPLILLIARISNTECMATILPMLTSQTYKNIQVKFITDSSVEHQLPQNMSVLNENEVEILLSNKVDGYVGLLKGGIEYGENYIQDLVNATRYQPEAKGWSKSHQDDKFAFDCDALQFGSIFKAIEINGLADFCVNDKRNIFTIDSDEINIDTAIRNEG